MTLNTIPRRYWINLPSLKKRRRKKKKEKKILELMKLLKPFVFDLVISSPFCLQC